MKKSIQMQMEGYEVVEKKAEAGGNSARIYVPRHWMGKKVRAVLVNRIPRLSQSQQAVGLYASVLKSDNLSCSSFLPCFLM